MCIGESADKNIRVYGYNDEETRFEVTPGYVIDDMRGAAQYDGMPRLRFQLVLSSGENGHFAFSLGKYLGAAPY